jgi:hypothetical protein
LENKQHACKICKTIDLDFCPKAQKTAKGKSENDEIIKGKLNPKPKMPQNFSFLFFLFLRTSRI